MSFTSCLEKQASLKKFFTPFSSKQEIYKAIMGLKKRLPPFDKKWAIEENRVEGCQSLTFLHSITDEERLRFFIQSDALLSSGLAALLLWVYDNETAETVVLCPPYFVKELHLTDLLSPGRSNGFFSIHLEMKRRALKVLSTTNIE